MVSCMTGPCTILDKACDVQSMVTWVSKTNWHHLAGMLWRDMRQLAMRLDNKQRLGLCWVSLSFEPLL